MDSQRSEDIEVKKYQIYCAICGYDECDIVMLLKETMARLKPVPRYTEISDEGGYFVTCQALGQKQSAYHCNLHRAIATASGYVLALAKKDKTKELTEEILISEDSSPTPITDEEEKKPIYEVERQNNKDKLKTTHEAVTEAAQIMVETRGPTDMDQKQLEANPSVNADPNRETSIEELAAMEGPRKRRKMEQESTPKLEDLFSEEVAALMRELGELIETK